MLISIWGRDGVGKSMLADALGGLFLKKGIAVVIDTDLTQPTLPMHMNGKKIDPNTSLGKAVSGIGTSNVETYLHQHPKREQLFYAGLTDQDEYLTYEIGLEADDKAQDFIEGCWEAADTVILDLSGQRVDPFIPCALIHSDKVIVPITLDVQGVCWYNAVKSLLKSMNAQGSVLPVAAMTDRHHDLPVIEKGADILFAAVLPFVKEFRQDSTMFPLDGTSSASQRYVKQVKKLYAMLEGGGED